MPCPASTKLMRRSSSAQWTINVGEDSTLLVPYSPTRVALVITAVQGRPLYLSLRLPAAVGVGLFLDYAGGPLVLNIGDHGEMVRGSIYAVSGEGAQDVTCWDSHLPDPLGE